MDPEMQLREVMLADLAYIQKQKQLQNNGGGPRKVKTESRGHALKNVSRLRWTQGEQEELLAMHEAGYSPKELALEFGVTLSAIYGMLWRLRGGC